MKFLVIRELEVIKLIDKLKADIKREAPPNRFNDEHQSKAEMAAAMGLVVLETIIKKSVSMETRHDVFNPQPTPKGN